VYFTYLGGTAQDWGNGIAMDRTGNTYVTGQTFSTNFPTMNPLQPKNGGGWDAFVAKIMYANTTAGLTSSPNPSTSGKPVTFTATVLSPSGGTPTGNVAFWNGAVALGKKKLSGGAVSFTTSALPLGLNSVTAVYECNSDFASSASAPVSQLVLAATTTTVSSSQNPSTYGQPVTFTAVVTSVIGAPPDGETVTFVKGGGTVLGTGTLSGGTAIFTTSTLNVGTFPIRAEYGGDSNFSGSKSNVVKQVVDKATD